VKYYFLRLESSGEYFYSFIPHAPLAQLDRASGFEPDGWRFESVRAHHLNTSQKRYFGQIWEVFIFYYLNSIPRQNPSKYAKL